MVRRRLLPVLAALFLALPVSAEEGKLSDSELIERLFSDPAYLSVKLSPDGKHLAVLRHYHGKRSLYIHNLQTGKTEGTTVDEGNDISSYDWIDNERVVFDVTKWEYFKVGFFVYELGKGSLYEPHRFNYSRMLWLGLEDPLLKQEGKFIFTADTTSGGLHPHLYEYDVKNSTGYKRLAENTGDISFYITNMEGKPIYALESKGGMIQVLKRDKEEERWEREESFESNAIPVDLLADDRHLVMLVDTGSGCEGISLYDLEKGEFVGSPRGVAGYDLFESSILDNTTGRSMGVHYHQAKPGNFWFEETFAKLENILKQRLPDVSFEFVGMDGGENAVYYIVSSDVITDRLIRFELNSGKIELVLHRYPEMHDMVFHTMEPVSFLHEGADHPIHGYLTRPKGEGPYPTVLLVHGGPNVRDVWNFNPKVQLLAKSGFAVLQVNYRGSSGYGKAYSLRGLIEVAEASVEDVIAGAKWLIREGIADPDRIGIEGGSFGGYISMEAAAREPELFSAVAGFAGLYDFNDLYKADNHLGYTWVDDFFHDYDEEAYARISPVNHADRIKAPVLIVHGKADQRVSAKPARQMVRALNEAGTPVESYFTVWGVHGLPEEKGRFRYYGTLLAFLKKHLQE